MKIVIGSDHAGFALKQEIVTYLTSLKIAVLDSGTNGTHPVDYPDYAAKVAQIVLDKKADRGIVICGSGVGACIVANKYRGIRAGICHDTYSAKQGVNHDDMNVLVMGSRVIGAALAIEIVQGFIDAQFSADERHMRRLKKIETIETTNFK